MHPGKSGYSMAKPPPSASDKGRIVNGKELMSFLSIFILLTHTVNEIYKQTHVHRLDWPMCGHRKPTSAGMTKHDMTRAILVVADTASVGNRLQVFDTPITRISRIFAKSFAAFDTNIWYRIRYQASRLQ